MSPTEDDLRRVLSDGAGDAPNVNTIIAAAHDRRANRQKRLLSAAAAVVIVGGVATGGVFLAHSGGSGETAGASRNDADGSSTFSHAGPMVPYTACPANPVTSSPSSRLGSAGSTSGKLFAKPVATVTVCSYPSTGVVGVLPGAVSSSAGAPNSAYGSTLRFTSRVQLAGSQAATLVRSLENADKSRPAGACPDYRMADQRTLVILARATDGTLLPAVRTTLDEPSCAVVVTNGTATRYGWAWPASLKTQPTTNPATGSTPAGAGASSSSSIVPPSDRVNGSPAH